MFRKSFVSIYFLPDRILVFQLSPNKKKVIRHGQIILPEGLIKENRIQTFSTLSKVISSAWQKLHIKEKAVGVILPEFSTFTKLFKLPTLSVSELDEAIRWQAQDYLPTTSENMILDWKIIRKVKSGYEVMVVAVAKEVLTEYVSVCEQAGLFPLMVATPSICLTRYSKKEGGGTLLIYRNFGEFILTLSEGEKIVGTSIQYQSDFSEILKVAQRMINHYGEVKVEKVLVGGDGVEAHLEAISGALKVKATKIDPAVGGLSNEDVQKNLIPLSLQYEETDEPSSPTTLNLLPSRLVAKYKFERLKVQVWSLTLTITLFVWISFFVTMGSYLFMVQNISDLKASNLRVGSDASTETFFNDIKSINEVTDKVLEIKKISVLPQTIFNIIYESKPEGVFIDAYELDLDKGEAKVVGRANDRVTLITFKENLEGIEEIGSVQIPISSFEAETNLDFSLSFLYLPISSTVKESVKRVVPRR